MVDRHILGRYDGVQKGPLLIAVGAMHGNEPAGVEAIRLMLKMLEVEPITNYEFEYSGRFLGLIGNSRAFDIGDRFIKKDLNRQWTKENVDRIMLSEYEDLEAEDLEIKELIEIINAEIEEYQPDKIVFLDLHTTTAYGGIFSIATDDPESLRIAVELHAPVMKGFLKGIKGTSLHYFNKDYFHPNIVPICFESGQHDELLSINRAIAALTNCMRTIGSVSEYHVENKHDVILIEYSKGLPKVAELLTIHRIEPTDGFTMLPNYKNFQKVKKGDVIAFDRGGDIQAAFDGYILMPLYQKQGEDGYFIIKEIDEVDY